MKTEKYEGGKKYVTVLSDGKFHQTVEAGTEGAIERTYKDKEDVEHTKTELVWDSVSGMITKIYFEDGEFGNNIQIEIDNDGIISLGTSSNYGEDFMKKLPNIDISKEVKLAPYSFEDDKAKLRKGITVIQDDKKIESAYYNKETKEATGGIPVPNGDEKTSDDWKVYFITVRKFLVAEVEKLISKNNWGM